ncbi:MAG: ISKra4 family transposase [Nitrososphaera sp.]|nr:ISKra4 family transposase [Nitrososphaera sp.]
MTASVISLNGDEVTLEVKFRLTASMLETEENILAALNEAGCVGTEKALERFDTDGDGIEFGSVKWSSKGKLPKIYQTPYGEVQISRHVYQRSEGGKTFCPMERDARIVVTSTPRFAKMVSHKYANGASTIVRRDLLENHGRDCPRSFLQNLSDAVGSVAQAKEENWHYETPNVDKPVSTVSIGTDGTCMLLCEDGYREAMTGTVTLYDREGERQHTVYIGATPEYGKATFYERMDREISHIKNLYPDATYVGLADGAKCNWEFLEPHTTVQILDFYHAAEYITKASYAAHPRNEGQREQWVENHCHDLKHKQGAASRLIKELEEFRGSKLSESVRKDLEQAITYFSNHKHQMHYARYRAKGFPIGSGVTEAACKTLVKQRLCCSGMKWVERGARVVLSLRALVLTNERWQQFWSKINQYGIYLPA